MELSINLFMTLDGVSQGPGGPDEDPRNGFTRGGWLMPSFDDGCGDTVSGWFERSGALLLGRRTFDTFASHWPHVTDPTDLVADRINNHRKYVVTSTPTGETWSDTTTVPGEDLVTEITRLKEVDSDLELQVHGSIQLARSLHRAGLVDVYRFLIAPVVLGQGAGIFDGDGPARGMRIESSRMTDSGNHAVVMRPQDIATPLRAGIRDGRDVIVEA